MYIGILYYDSKHFPEGVLAFCFFFPARRFVGLGASSGCSGLKIV